MENLSNETEMEQQNSSRNDITELFGFHIKTHLNETPFRLCSCLCSQAPLRRGLFNLSGDPFSLHPAQILASACGTSSGTTLERTSPKWRCPCSWTSRSTRCRGCARSWSTASCWTRLPTRRTLSSVWWVASRSDGTVLVLQPLFLQLDRLMQGIWPFYFIQARFLQVW